MDKRSWTMTVTTVVMTFGLALGLAMAQNTASQSDDPDCKAPSAKHTSPFACDRLALDETARKRHFDELGPALRGMRQAVRELPNGYEFQFPADPKSVALVAEWAAGERLCCPFFNIELRLEPEHGPLWLRLTGRKGTKEFLKVDGASWLPSPKSGGSR